MLKEVGGQVNAFTSEDITALPRHGAALVRRLRACSSRPSACASSSCCSRRSTPSARWSRRRSGCASTTIRSARRSRSSARSPSSSTRTTGRRSAPSRTCEKVTPADCQRFYDTYYQPNNATLIVVGDIDEADGAQAGRAALRSHPARPRAAAPRRRTSRRRRRCAPRRMRIEVQIPVVVGGYHIPRAADPDMPALEVLATALSSGESSRLHQRLVRRERLAIAAGGVRRGAGAPGLFIIYAAYLPDRDAAKVQAVLTEEIARVRDKPIAADELDKAKNQLAAGFVFGLQTVDGVARALGRARYVEGDWRRFVQGADRYLAVTADDVQRVARKYLIDTNLTLRDAGAAGARGGALGQPPPRRRRPPRRGEEVRPAVQVRSARALLAAALAVPACAGSGRRQTRGHRRLGRRAIRRRRAGAAAAAKPTHRPGVLGRPQGSDPGAAAAQAGGAGAAEGRALLAQERPRGHRRPAQGAADRHLQPVDRGGRLRREPRRARRVRLRGRHAPARHQDPQRRRHLALDRLRRRIAGRARDQREPRPRAARRCRRTRPCAWTCWPTSCCGRRSPRPRWPRCAIRCWPASPRASTAPTSCRWRTSRNLLFGEKNPEGWVLTAEDVNKHHPRAAGDVLADVLPAEPRHPRGRG